jgi:uncharacterized protein YbjT (DUF2867 family)
MVDLSFCGVSLMYSSSNMRNARSHNHDQEHDMTNQEHIAFVAGATGYTGNGVVQACVARGMRVVAHVRPDSSQRAHWEQKLKGWGAEVDTTPWSLPEMETRLAALKPTQVYGLIGTVTHKAQKEGVTDRYRTIDYGLSALLMEAAASLQPMPRFIYLSAAGVSQNRGAYMLARFDAEKHLHALGLPYVIARPGLITGDREESRPMEALFGAISKPVGRALKGFGAKSLGAMMTPMTGHALARALVDAAAREENVILEPLDLQRLADQRSMSK